MRILDELLTIDELDANTRRLASDSRISLTILGHSRSNRPILMISLGDGDRDALIVGVPHANEPVGAVTVERMIDVLLGPDGGSQRRGYRWHFVKAIDPEGLRLNAGWLKKPRTLKHYLENYFRPALDRQPEMTFPLDALGLVFDRSTPENLAWRKALALTRPVLHASLHHCDFGGAFHAISRVLPDLLPELDRIIVNSGLTFNGYSDGAIIAERISASVSIYPPVSTIIPRAIAMGAGWASPWSWGEMSPGFGEATHGTFTIITEVPLWDDPRLRDEGPSTLTWGKHLRELRRVATTANAQIARHTEALAPWVDTLDGDEFLLAAREMVRISKLTGDPPDDKAMISSESLSIRDEGWKHVQFVLFALRAHGLILGLSRQILEAHPDSAAAQLAMAEAGESLNREIASIERRVTLTPVPVSVLTEVQMNAIFACADILGK